MRSGPTVNRRGHFFLIIFINVLSLLINILSNHFNFGSLYKEFILSSISKSVRVEFETSNIKLCDCFSCFSTA